jgi:hypothetical protein
MFEALFGGLLGGLFRLAPEVLKWLDRGAERKHELDMTDKQIEFERMRGEMKMDAINAQGAVTVTQSELKTLSSALDQQTSMVAYAHKWIASLSASVRPVITYAAFGLYAAVKVAMIVSAFISNDGDIILALLQSWGEPDWSMLMMILGFWFVSRTLDKKL